MADIIQGARKAPPRIFVYGPSGVGKTTFAAESQDPCFISAEAGHSEMDVKSYVFAKSNGRERVHAVTWEEMLKACSDKDLLGEKGGRTMVFDGFGAMESLCASFVCKRERWTDIGSPGFGNGEKALLAEMGKLLAAIEEMWSAGKAIILVAHEKLEKIKNPEGSEYQRHAPALTTANNADVAGKVIGWCDAVLFARPEIEIAEINKRAIGVSTGRHILHTQGAAGFVAKCRYGNVDAVLDLSFPTFWGQVEEGQSVERMRAKVEKMAAKCDPETAKRVAAWLATPDAQRIKSLLRSAERLKAASEAAPATAAA